MFSKFDKLILEIVGPFVDCSENHSLNYLINFSIIFLKHYFNIKSSGRLFFLWNYGSKFDTELNYDILKCS